jgi:hypothetical protein
MRGSLRWLIGSICVLTASCAWAGGGRIEFAGAVVEPTCSVETLAIEAAARQSQVTGPSSRQSCGQAPGDTARSYSRTVFDLDAAVIAHDRLLGYFASYASPASSGEQAKLVVRTYE